MLHSGHFIETLLIADSVAACHHHMMPGLDLLWLPGAFAGFPGVHVGLRIWWSRMGQPAVLIALKGKGHEKVQQSLVLYTWYIWYISCKCCGQSHKVWCYDVLWTSRKPCVEELPHQKIGVDSAGPRDFRLRSASRNTLRHPAPQPNAAPFLQRPR
jgi:hypothetical protein